MGRHMIRVVAVSCALLVQSVVFACGCERLQHLVNSLKLSHQQQEKVQPILTQLKSTLKKDVGQMGSIREQLQQQVVSSHMDQAKVDGLIDQKTRLIGDMMRAKVAAKHQIYMLLDEHQQTVFKHKMKNMVKKWSKKCHE